jgi:hypothetical protein
MEGTTGIEPLDLNEVSPAEPTRPNAYNAYIAPALPVALSVSATVSKYWIFGSLP